MTASTIQIDLDVLNELLNNQKKLDDILLFDDEDFLFGSSSSTTKNKHEESHSIDTFGSKDDFNFSSDDSIMDVQSRSVTSFVAPVILELVALYYGITYFT